jgi:hypothetical protein
MKSALLWGITQRRVVILSQRFTLDDGTDTLSRNVGKGLPIDAV